MPEPRTINFAIIGGGLMGREFASAVARWCHLVDPPARPRIVAVASRSESSLGWFKGAIPGVRTTTDWRQAVHADDVDAVYCAVPHDLHEPMYVEIVEAGKHLFGEKPFGIDKPANDRINAAIARHPELVVRCSSEFVFYPGVQRIVRMVREGRIGQVLEVECGFLHASDMDPDKPINWKRQVKTNGAYGVMGDLGLHVWHVPLRLGWTPGNVRAVLTNVITERPDMSGRRVPCDTWDNATLLCEIDQADQRFPLTARMQRIAPGETNTWYLTVKGTRMSARFSTREPRTLWTMSYQPGQATQAWCAEALGYEPVYKTITGRIFEFGFGDAMQQMIVAFSHRVAVGDVADVPFDCATPPEAATTHEIFTAALRSNEERATVPV